MFLKFIEDLEKRLSEPLPGQTAQKTMAPKTNDDKRFNLEDKKGARTGGVLILLYPCENKIYLPLIKRPEYGGVHSGQISLPGGKRERDDQSLIETALRETEEEIGVHKKKVKVLGSLTELYITVSNFKVKPVIGFTLEEPEFIPDRKEVVHILEADLYNLINDNTRKIKEIIVERTSRQGKMEYSLNAPYFDVQGNIVWGATAMILGEFVTIVKEIHRNY